MPQEAYIGLSWKLVHESGLVAYNSSEHFSTFDNYHDLCGATDNAVNILLSGILPLVLWWLQKAYDMTHEAKDRRKHMSCHKIVGQRGMRISRTYPVDLSGWCCKQAYLVA